MQYFSITNEELKKHFLTKVGHVVDVRIPKKDANTARGFAYVELGNNVDYEVCLCALTYLILHAHKFCIITYYFVVCLTESTFATSLVR